MYQPIKLNHIYMVSVFKILPISCKSMGMNTHFFTTTPDFILSQFCHKSAVGNIFWQLGTNPLWKNCENAILSLKEEDVIAPVLLREAHRFFHQPMWPSGNKKVLVHLRITNSHFYVFFHCRYDAAWLPCCHAIPSDLFSCRNFIFAQTSRWLSREDTTAMLILVDWRIHSLFEHCKQPCSV